MNATVSKLIRLYCKIHKEDYKMRKNQFKKMPREAQLQLIAHMKKYV